jgi:hypothetical protein
MARETMALTGGNAGERPPAPGVVGSLACSSLALPMQPQGSKRAPLPESGVLSGRGGGDRPYVHTPIGTSHGHTFTGSTSQYLERERKKFRFKYLMAVVASMARCGREDQARALMSCGRYFERINFPCGSYKLIPHYCDSVFCPECAARRSKPLQEKILGRLNQKKYHYFFLTLTVRNWKDLTNAGLRRLLKQFAKIRGLDAWKKEVRGGVYSVETTYNSETQEWHPHLHVLLECRQALPSEWLGNLKASWRRVTGSHVIHIERMYGTNQARDKKRRLNRAGLKELVKYATKSASFGHSPELVDTFLTAFENVRRMQSFGSFLGVQKEADKEAEKVSDPTEDKFALVGCKCGMCTWIVGVRCHDLVHISQTVLAFDGSRQLKLFDSGTDPPGEKPIEPQPTNAFVVARGMENSLFAPQFRLAGL